MVVHQLIITSITMSYDRPEMFVKRAKLRFHEASSAPSGWIRFIAWNIPLQLWENNCSLQKLKRYKYKWSGAKLSWYFYQVRWLFMNHNKNIINDYKLQDTFLGSSQPLMLIHADLMSIEPLGANINEIVIKIQSFSYNKLYLKCRLLNVDNSVSASAC